MQTVPVFDVRGVQIPILGVIGKSGRYFQENDDRQIAKPRTWDWAHQIAENVATVRTTPSTAAEHGVVRVPYVKRCKLQMH